jgi:hypothetical protein
MQTPPDEESGGVFLAPQGGNRQAGFVGQARKFIKPAGIVPWAKTLEQKTPKGYSDSAGSLTL